ncbi:MAG: DUF167 domain-containing protein [Alphaproteobacteria bacterium]
MATEDSKDTPFRAVADGVIVRVLGAPKASRNQIDGIVASGHGAAVKVRVTAAPDKGKANAAILAVLAKAWRLPVGQLALATGDTDRHKTVLVAGHPTAVLRHLNQWARDRDG